MGIRFTLLLSLAIMLNSIELSSAFECLPNGAPIPGVPRTGRSYSHDIQNFSERSTPPLKSRSSSPSARLSPVGLPSTDFNPALFPSSEFNPAELHPDASSVDRSHHDRPSSSDKSSPSMPHSTGRGIVPPTRLPSYHKRGWGLENLPFIRLACRTNLRRVFVLRRYTFPGDTPLKLRLGYHMFDPMPTQEQIVISSADGDVFAILQTTTNLAGMYINNGQRAKISMESGMITLLTKAEVDETPVGWKRPILKSFKVTRVNNV